MDSAVQRQVEQSRSERIGGDKTLLMMSLEHAKRHAADIAQVAMDEATRAKAFATLTMITAMQAEWEAL
jgi:hypothetical protein